MLKINCLYVAAYCNTSEMLSKNFPNERYLEQYQVSLIPRH